VGRRVDPRRTTATPPSSWAEHLLEQPACGSSATDWTRQQVGQIRRHRFVLLEPDNRARCPLSLDVPGTTDGAPAHPLDRSQRPFGVDHPKDSGWPLARAATAGEDERFLGRCDGASQIVIDERAYEWREHGLVGQQGTMTFYGQITPAEAWTPEKMSKDARIEAPSSDQRALHGEHPNVVLCAGPELDEHRRPVAPRRRPHGGRRNLHGPPRNGGRDQPEGLQVIAVVDCGAHA
jgi:hypothetical protein